MEDCDKFDYEIDLQTNPMGLNSEHITDDYF